MDVTLDRMKAGIFKFKGIRRVGADVVCEAELMCTMRTIA
jgi:3-hydroxyacyl-[acyl-carrier-protein] dehydratase